MWTMLLDVWLIKGVKRVDVKVRNCVEVFTVDEGSQTSSRTGLPRYKHSRSKKEPVARSSTKYVTDPIKHCLRLGWSS